MATENQTQTTEQDQVKSEGDSPRALRTFETDIAEYSQGKNLSLVDIALEEAKFRGEGLKMGGEDDLPSARKAVFAAIIIFIFLAALGGAYFGLKGSLFGRLNERKISDNLLIDNGPILTDDKLEIIANVDRPEVFLREVDRVFNSGLGGLTRLVVTKNVGDAKAKVSTKEFFQLIKANMPPELSDYLGSDFLLLRFEDDASHPVLIFKTDSYEYVFSYLLKWEKSILWEFRNLFTGKKEEKTGGVFQDKFIQNRDVRISYNDDGSVQLAYSFINRKYFILADNEKALAETFQRFASSQYVNPNPTW